MNTAPSNGISSKGTAVVTGASSGIGKIYADRLARQGYNLHLVARREERLQELSERLHQAYGVTVQTTTADLTDPNQLNALVVALSEDQSITVLVNNAGDSLMGPIVDSDPVKSEALIALNVTALTRLTLAALRGFKARDEGTIINIASVVAFGAYPGVGVYSATKAYVLHFTRVLQLELQGTNIVAQVVAPAATVSEGWDRASALMDHPLDPSMVMTTEDCVDASLRGLEKGESITVPAAEDASLITAFLTAGNDLFLNTMTGKPASRYGLPSGR